MLLLSQSISKHIKYQNDTKFNPRGNNYNKEIIKHIKENNHDNDITISNDSVSSKETKFNSFSDSLSLDTQLNETPMFKKLPAAILNSIYRQILKEDQSHKKPMIDFTKQSTISCDNYTMLIEWIISVRSFIQISDECLFLTIKNINLFLKRVYSFNQEKLQLIGLASLFLSSKYIEGNQLSLEDIFIICNHHYSKKDILLCELYLLSVLDYTLEQDDLINFFDLLALMFHFNLKEYYQGKLFLELTLFDINITKYRRAVIAFTVAYLVMKLNIERHPNYHICFFYLKDREGAEIQLKECGKQILDIIEKLKCHKKFTIDINRYSALTIHN